MIFLSGSPGKSGSSSIDDFPDNQHRYIMTNLNQQVHIEAPVSLCQIMGKPHMRKKHQIVRLRVTVICMGKSKNGSLSSYHGYSANRMSYWKNYIEEDVIESKAASERQRWRGIITKSDIARAAI